MAAIHKLKESNRINFIINNYIHTLIKILLIAEWKLMVVWQTVVCHTFGRDWKKYITQQVWNGGCSDTSI